MNCWVPGDPSLDAHLELKLKLVQEQAYSHFHTHMQYCPLVHAFTLGAIMSTGDGTFADSQKYELPLSV